MFMGLLSHSVKTAGLICSAVFLFPFFVNADQVYQQLTNNSGTIISSGSGVVSAGSFVSDGTYQIAVDCVGADTCSGIPYGLIVASSDYGSAFGITIFVSTSTTFTDGSDTVSHYNFGIPATANSPTFVAPYAISADHGNYDYLPGVTYYFYLASPVPVTLAADSVGDFFGFISDPLGASLPISPNIPGFTDVGISTTTQAINCANNFGTSTGFLSDIGSNISVGICDVAVYLFVPSIGVLQEFRDFGSTTQSKFPFSYIQGFGGVFSSLTASTTANIPKLSIGLGDLGIGSTTPLGNILPNFDLLSTTTVTEYLPSGVWSLFLWLISAGLWLNFGFTIFNDALKRFRRV